MYVSSYTKNFGYLVDCFMRTKLALKDIVFKAAISILIHPSQKVWFSAVSFTNKPYLGYWCQLWVTGINDIVGLSAY